MTTPTTTSNTDNGGGLFSDDKAGGFAYGVGVSAGILLLITTITLASYFCTRGSSVEESDDDNQRRRRQHHGEECVIEVVAGIDEATLKTYPKLAYSQLLLKKKGSSTTSSSGSCCSICLADYKGNDVVRLLPDCGHVFHLKCVDPWLRVHPTCPVCRTSPLPTPQSTPLAGVAPVAAATSAGAGAAGLGA